jgi:hypothetical protein
MRRQMGWEVDGERFLWLLLAVRVVKEDDGWLACGMVCRKLVKHLCQCFRVAVGSRGNKGKPKIMQGNELGTQSCRALPAIFVAEPECTGSGGCQVRQQGSYTAPWWAFKRNQATINRVKQATQFCQESPALLKCCCSFDHTRSLLRQTGFNRCLQQRIAVQRSQGWWQP